MGQRVLCDSERLLFIKLPEKPQNVSGLISEFISEFELGHFPFLTRYSFQFQRTEEWNLQEERACSRKSASCVQKGL